MEDVKLIFKLLKSSGIRPIGIDSQNLYIEDPSCIARSFETFLEHTWIVLTFITGLFLVGLAWGMIRGNKNFNFNLISKNVVAILAIFATFSAIPVVVNFIYGGDLIGKTCKTVTIPTKQVKDLLDLRKATLKKYDAYNLYEDLIVYDSGTTITESTETTNEINTTNTSTANSSSTPVNATQSEKETIYTDSNGTQYKKVGGTLAWRNNNPGNIRYSEFSRRAGAIGSAHGFAVFPDEQTGRNAIKKILASNSYKDLTIANAVSRYAPPTENNTAGYQRSLAKLTGLSVNRRISDLSDTEIDSVVEAIEQIEGWEEGKTVSI